MFTTNTEVAVSLAALAVWAHNLLTAVHAFSGVLS